MDRPTFQTAYAILMAAGDLPGGVRMLQALTYLVDRRLGRVTRFESSFHGPYDPELPDELQRWIASGNARKTITYDDRVPDPIEGATTTLSFEVGARGHERAAPSSDVMVAREILGIARGCGALAPTSIVIAAKLAWIREIGGDRGRNTTLEELAADLQWSMITPTHRIAGLELARSLGY